MIAVEGGDHDSLKMIQQMYKDGDATKDDYAKALQAYQAYLDEIKSDDRDEAAAYSDRYKYYEWYNTEIVCWVKSDIFRSELFCLVSYDERVQAREECKG